MTSAEQLIQKTILKKILNDANSVRLNAELMYNMLVKQDKPQEADRYIAAATQAQELMNFAIEKYSG